MRTSQTFRLHLRGTRKPIVFLVLSLVAMAILPTTDSASRADDPLNPTIPVQFVDFNGFADTFGQGMEVYGQIYAPNPAGVTVTFAGAINGTTVTDTYGNFYHFVPGYTPGLVTASVSVGAESDSRDLNL